MSNQQQGLLWQHAHSGFWVRPNAAVAAAQPPLWRQVCCAIRTRSKHAIGFARGHSRWHCVWTVSCGWTLIRVTCKAGVSASAHVFQIRNWFCLIDIILCRLSQNRRISLVAGTRHERSIDTSYVANVGMQVGASMCTFL
jgi:hypothetical protein